MLMFTKQIKMTNVLSKSLSKRILYLLLKYLVLHTIIRRIMHQNVLLTFKGKCSFKKVAYIYALFN